MSFLSALISSLPHRDDEGQGLAEYALILALIAIVAIVALIFLGGQVSTILSHRRQPRSSDRSEGRAAGQPAARPSYSAHPTWRETGTCGSPVSSISGDREGGGGTPRAHAENPPICSQRS